MYRSRAGTPRSRTSDSQRGASLKRRSRMCDFLIGLGSGLFALIVSAAISAWLTASHPNSEVKQVRAGVVLRWGTTREGPVLRFLFLFRCLPFESVPFFALFCATVTWTRTHETKGKKGREKAKIEGVWVEEDRRAQEDVSKAESNSCDCSSPTDLKSAPRTVQDHADLSSNPGDRDREPSRRRDGSRGLHYPIYMSGKI
eukprot:scaffold44766_cov64-Phaeocystis_antarctica.AAC.4